MLISWPHYILRPQLQQLAKGIPPCLSLFPTWYVSSSPWLSGTGYINFSPRTGGAQDNCAFQGPAELCGAVVLIKGRYGSMVSQPSSVSVCCYLLSPLWKSGVFIKFIRIDMVRDVPGHLLLSLELGYVLEWFWISAGNSNSRESIAIPHSSAIWKT